MNKPNWKVGDKIESVNTVTGAADTAIVVEAGNGLIKLISDGGTKVTKSDTWFAPALEWDDQGEKGKSVVDWELGSLWPLKAGNKAYFHRVITLDDGRQKEENWRCSVEGPISTKLTPTSAERKVFKITAVSEGNIHSWHWDATEGVGPLAYSRTVPGDALGGPQETYVRAGF